MQSDIIASGAGGVATYLLECRLSVCQFLGRVAAAIDTPGIDLDLFKKWNITMNRTPERLRMFIDRWRVVRRNESASGIFAYCAQIVHNGYKAA